ncbi:carboxypeptidase-like regulatory domain-containing protein [Chitinophaga sp. 212800010-3]|uniref:carboxypeptidase-like regulatory domain-containing protein n=1 Tax=unclassified Chitinophaga TaxID=2619133 RepID=UPI002E0DE326
MRSVVIFLLLNFLILDAFSQENTDGKPFPDTYSVGYKEYRSIDSSRRYKPGVGKDSRLLFRPLEFDTWFPSKGTSRDSLMPFRYFVSLFEARAGRFQDSIKLDGLTDEMMHYFSANGTKINAGDLSHLQTRSHLNAEEVKHKFPLIIYMSAFNGMSYENISLFEYLASHGYIVVAISSIGRYPGNMTTKYADLLEQVNDAKAALTHFLHNENVDTSKIGVMGYSYGSLGASVLAMQNKSVQALLSLDGSEVHYYGGEQEEDLDFDTLRKCTFFDPAALQLPYAYLESDHKLENRNVDSVYHLQPLFATKKYYLRLLNTDHEDFSGLSALSNVNTSDKRPYDLVKRLVLDYFDQHLGGRKSTFDNNVVAVIKAKSGTSSFIKVEKKASDSIGWLVLKGKIVTENNNPISYVNIGIPKGNIGTVSGEDGVFSLRVNKSLLNDSVRISSIGYKQKSYVVEQLLSALSNQPVITLSGKDEQLREVIVTADNIRLKTVGNTNKSRFISVGFPLRELGSELGVKIYLGRKDVLLRAFNFNISENRLDSGIFRINIYAVKEGMPTGNLLQQNIIVSIGNKTGAYKIDLTPYHLQLKGEVLVSLEWLAGTAAVSHGAIFFSAGFLNSSTYHRKTSEAAWTRTKGMGAGFNLVVQ